MKKDVDEHDIVIKFANKKAAKEFALWLCEHAEQDYWEWMRGAEEESSDKNMTVIGFHYHGQEDETKAQNDPKRYGEFMCDNTIRTTLGRLDND